MVHETDVDASRAHEGLFKANRWKHAAQHKNNSYKIMPIKR